MRANGPAQSSAILDTQALLDIQLNLGTPGYLFAAGRTLLLARIKVQFNTAIGDARGLLLHSNWRRPTLSLRKPATAHIHRSL